MGVWIRDCPSLPTSSDLRSPYALVRGRGTSRRGCGRCPLSGSRGWPGTLELAASGFTSAPNRAGSPELRERAVRLVLDPRSGHETQWAAIVALVRCVECAQAHRIDQVAHLMRATSALAGLVGWGGSQRRLDCTAVGYRMQLTCKRWTRTWRTSKSAISATM